jgi:hypothetical protein
MTTTAAPSSPRSIVSFLKKASKNYHKGLLKRPPYSPEFQPVEFAFFEKNDFPVAVDGPCAAKCF